MIHRSGGGPKPIPQKQLTANNLADAIKVAVSPEAKSAAGKMGEKIRSESGEEKGVQSFHAHLPLKSMVWVPSCSLVMSRSLQCGRCDVTPSRAAQWWSRTLLLRLSNAAAGVLVDAGKIKWESLDHLSEMLGMPFACSSRAQGPRNIKPAGGRRIPSQAQQWD